ncbi:MAG: outer membrane lipoprotein-sorting protein [Candidatus Omnitrophica bacterium]|nr:outer membrane lipoprotein-sorting protein [Candidatus Omnitrophota bacterium]
MIKRVIFFLYLLLTSFPSHDARAGEPDAKEMVKRSDDLMRGDTSHGTYRMTVATPDWKRTLELDAYSSGRDKTFIRILSPQKEKGVSTLRVENNMWNFLPKVERTIKIAPSMMFQQWMGSDFANDDMVKESSLVNDYTHTASGEEIVDTFPALCIELIPKPGAAVTWGKLILWVRKSDSCPLKQEFYDEHNKLIKVLEYSAIKKMSDREIPTIWVITPVTKPGCSTTIEVLEIVYNCPLDKDIFTLSNLKRT